MRSPHLPVSPLTRIVFPVVYAQLLRSKGEEDFSIIPRLIMLPMSFFVDWDRAKSARHELVDVFLRSSWPPIDLLLTAIDAGIEREVLKRLSLEAREALNTFHPSNVKADIFPTKIARGFAQASRGHSSSP